MPAAEMFHGTRVFQNTDGVRPIAPGDYSTVGTVIVAPNADQDDLPYGVIHTRFTADTSWRAALGTGGNVNATMWPWDKTGVNAELQFICVPEGAGTGQAQLEATIANIVGSGSNNSGVHAFKTAPKPVKLAYVAGYSSQRISNAKNPVAAELDGIMEKSRGIKLLDTTDTSKEAAKTYRDDFTDDKRAYLLHPSVIVYSGATPIAQPLSGYAAAMFVKRDKEVGGPFESPSSQAIGGVAKPSRPIPYYDGDPDSEANWLNQQRITTIKGANILWGNRTCALDPYDTFVNVVRVLDYVDEAVLKAFYPIDRNLSVPRAVSIVQTVDFFLGELTKLGALIGGRAWFVKDLNEPTSLVSGILRVHFDREPAAPIEDLQFFAGRNIDYYYTFADNVLQTLDRRIT